MVLIKIHLASSAATVAGVIQHFHIHTEDLDTSFGVVPVDRAKDTYAVRVSEPAAKIIEACDDTAQRQSDPRIAPMGILR
jgi:hypothetical protein